MKSEKWNTDDSDLADKHRLIPKFKNGKCFKMKSEKWNTDDSDLADKHRLIPKFKNGKCFKT